MAEAPNQALELIQRQLKEMDKIFEQLTRDLNAVAGKERLAKWKAHTVALLSTQVGPAEAKRLADTPPGRSFSYDAVEEVTDEAEPYQKVLQALAAELKAKGTGQ